MADAYSEVDTECCGFASKFSAAALPLLKLPGTRGVLGGNAVRTMFGTRAPKASVQATTLGGGWLGS